ncbi:type I-U CRISPR-associated protein Csx17 [Marinobacterium sp. D7]|uniref:type I-G CRISPR-associated protein Cas8g1/Csx17 n=1 Tax=Marinobacterium ramblicola TaxID=2849041 RepID=UPI001C2CD202|nr:type I-U CRISPR-associated protein Csx17 [Marinobacterium ramblicola]MBV1788008.1 type I-U CRISPR-associated protein Csx17 [Marinobacterium ramblicola]
MNRILLGGCAPTPLAHYLKALGILRLVAEQLDPEVKGAWRDDGFELYTQTNADELLHFFLYEYRPTPVLAPWNGGSGFYPKDNKEGIDPLGISLAPRFQPLRETIAAMRTALETAGYEERPDGEEKARFLALLRATLDDDALAWMDAALSLTDDGPRFPPLLGTGGNDGRLDFTNNYLKQLVQLFDPETGQPLPGAMQELPSALFAIATPGIGKGSVGQFAPGNSGGPNSSNGFEGGSSVNGWDFILMLEGALLFATGVTRRLETGLRGQLSYPFTVRMSGSGSGSAAQSDEANARAEMWLPLWSQAASLPELKNLLTEGRATLNCRGCRDGLDFARAVAQLGVDRGIGAFQRYAFVMRSGKAYLATPLDRIRVAQAPKSELINDLDQHRWLDQLRKAARTKEAPNSLRSSIQSLENALFDLTRRPTAVTLQIVLIRVGELAQWQAGNRKGRNASLSLPKLSQGWLREADDRSDAYRLASALAGIGTDGDLPIRAHLFPLEKGHAKGWRLNEQGENSLHTWSKGPLDRQLGKLIQRRMIAAHQQGQQGFDIQGRSPVDLTAVESFLSSDSLDRRIAALLPALALIDRPFPLPGRGIEAPGLPLAYRLLKPLFAGTAQLQAAGLLSDGLSLMLPADIPRLLAADHVGNALSIGLRRMRIAGFAGPGLLPSCDDISGPRLLAALMLPIHDASLSRLVRSAYRFEETTPSTH